MRTVGIGVELRTASWRAARSGLSGDLVSARTLRPVRAGDAVAELVDHVSRHLTGRAHSAPSAGV